MHGKVLVITGPDPFDADAICDRCGRRGTVVCSGRNDIPSATMRGYCRACWPAERAEQLCQSLEEGATHSTMQHDPAPSWDRLIALVVAVEKALVTVTGASDDRRRQRRMKIALFSVAREIAAVATRLGGPMPPVVQDFIDRNPPPG